MGRKPESKGGPKKMEKKGFKYLLRGPLRKGDMTHVSSSYAVQEQAGGGFLRGLLLLLLPHSQGTRPKLQLLHGDWGLGLRQNWGGSAKMAPRHACSGTALRETQHARYMPDLLGPFIPWLMAYR